MTTILTMGEILVEIVATTPGEGFREVQPLTGPYPSGAPAIFADQVARLGYPAAIAGRVGDDDFGHLNLARLSGDGVDVRAVAVVPGEVTGCAFVRYRPDGSRAFVFTMPQSAAARLPMTDAVRTAVAACGHLHVMGSALGVPQMADTVIAAVDAVADRGGRVSFDPNLRPELMGAEEVAARIDHVLGRTAILLPSVDEVLPLSGAADEEAAITAFRARGIAEIVVKRGARGATFFGSEGRIDAAAHQVDEVDPTGAGDCFGAAYVAFRSGGMAPAEALRRANAAGALAVTQLGPMEGAAHRDAVEALLEGGP